MKTEDRLALAWIAFRGHKLRTGLTILGVAIGVAAVVTLTSLGEGARRYVIGEFATLGTNLLVVLPGKIETKGVAPLMGGTPRDLTLEDAAALEREIPAIRRLAPITIGTAPARFGEKSRDVTVLGTTSEFRTMRNFSISYGAFLPASERDREAPVCVIGAKLGRELFDGANPLGRNLRVGDYRFRIIGVLAPRGTSMGFEIDEVLMIPVGISLRIFNRSSLFRIMIEGSTHEGLPAIERSVINVIKKRHDNREDITVFTEEAVLSTFDKIIEVLTLALGGIAAISLVVAGIGIMNVMLVSVTERRAEVGVMKAIGATSGQVTSIFLLEAAILSVLGGIVGLLGGLAAARVLRWVYPVFPATAPDWAIALALFVSIGLGLVFGAVPARRAARLDPIQALAKR